MNSNDRNAVGARQPSASDSNQTFGIPVSNQSRISSPLKTLVLIGAIVFGLLGGCAACVAIIGSDHTNNGTMPAAPSSNTSRPSAQDLDPSNYRPISARDYALLVTDPDTAKGQKLIVWGVVTQFDAATGTPDFRADTGGEQKSSWLDYEDNAFDHAPDPAILANVVETDMVVMYVDVAGSYSYGTQISGNPTVPLFNVDIVRVSRSGQ